MRASSTLLITTQGDCFLTEIDELLESITCNKLLSFSFQTSFMPVFD